MKKCWIQHTMLRGIACTAAAVLMISNAAGAVRAAAPETEAEEVDERKAALTASGYPEIYKLIQEYREREAIEVLEDYTSYDMAVYSTAESDEGSGGMQSYSMEAVSEKNDYSETNLREEGVNEADVVKTDGTFIYAMDSEGVLRILDAETLELLSEIPGADKEGKNVELYVEGDILQILRNAGVYETYRRVSTGEEEVRFSYSLKEKQSIVYTYDISDRTNPRLVAEYSQDGEYLTSRKKDGYLYLFTSYEPNKEITEDDYYTYIPEVGGDLIPADRMYYPNCPGQEIMYGGEKMLTASSLPDENPGEASDNMMILGGTGTFYVSVNNVYTASAQWQENCEKTDLVRIPYKDGKFGRGVTGTIPGEIDDSFCLDEYQGYLRAVTTEDGYVKRYSFWYEDRYEFKRDNSLFVLNQNLDIVGAVKDIAEDEEIKSARFMGDKAYFVTYRNTDPLFSADLSDPKEPKLLDELKVTGFSEYLHPYGEGQLLGIGWETDPDTGWSQGLKCSMFDIRNPEELKEIARLNIQDADSCSVLENYKGILINPDRNLLGFAYGSYAAGYGTMYYYAVLGYDKDEGFVPLAYLRVPESNKKSSSYGYQGTRGIYIENMFYLVNDSGICAYDMENDFKECGNNIWG